METFNWDVASGADEKAKPLVNVVELGDGYKERQPRGINNDLRTYSVTLTVPIDDAPPIDSFLTRHGAVKAFLWKEPNRNRLISVVCSSWSSKVMRAAKTITATFEEVVA